MIWTNHLINLAFLLIYHNQHFEFVHRMVGQWSEIRQLKYLDPGRRYLESVEEIDGRSSIFGPS